MKRDCSTCICKEGSCYPSKTIFDKDKTCKSYDPNYEGYIADLEEENTELKTRKIPQLERRIASIRGSHSVDAKKLNARIEQVERLKKENAELSMKRKAERKIFQGIVEKKSDQLAKAKEIIKELVRVEYADFTNGDYSNELSKVLEQAEQFLSEVEK